MRRLEKCQYARMTDMTPFQQRQLALMRQMEQSFHSNRNTATIVPMQSDFANDPQMALTAVSYLPKPLIDTITKLIIQPLKNIEQDFYYYPPEAMHITIQNVRVIHNPPQFTAEDIDIARSVFRQAALNINPFPFALQGVLSMPTSVSIIALGTPEYNSFVKRLRRDLTNAHVPDDKSYFTDELVFANATICRYTHEPSDVFIQKLQELRDQYIGDVVINETALVTMNASANRSKTTILETYQFGQK